MESQYSQNELIRHIIKQMIDASDMIMVWNETIASAEEYPASSAGFEKMAASCMLIEAIGEGVKKIERLLPGYLRDQSPDIQWEQIIGLRNHIAHGYFNLDAEIIFDVVKKEIPVLRETLERIKEKV